MDRIRLQGLRVVGTHGVLAEEQARAQPFEVDVELEVDLGPASRSDAVERVVREERFALLERIGGRIAEVVLGLDERIAAVTVSVTKLRPPVPVDLASASVRLRRDRP